MMDIAFPLMLSTSTVAIMLFIDRLYLKQVSQEAMNASLSGGFASDYPSIPVSVDDDFQTWGVVRHVFYKV